MSCLSKPGPTRRAKCVHKLVRPPQVSHPPGLRAGPEVQRVPWVVVCGRPLLGHVHLQRVSPTRVPFL